MNTVRSISILHVIFLTMTVIGLKNHVTIIPPLLQAGGRDSWMSVLLTTAAMLPWLFLWIYIQNKTNQMSIKDWLKQRIGKVGSAIVLYMLAFYLLISAASTMREMLQWVNATFLPQTPMLLMLIIYTFLCILLVTKSLQTFMIVNVLVLFWVVVFGFFVAFTNLQVKDYGLLHPFLEHGFEPVLKGMVYPASGFMEILLFIFLQHKIKKRVRWYHLVVILLIITGLTMGPLLGAIVEFGPDEAAKQVYPAYEEWGLVAIGRYIEHVDFFSIYQWLTGALIRIGFMLYIVADLFNMTGDSKRIWRILAPLFLIICLSIWLMGDNDYIAWRDDYMLKVTTVYFLLLSVFLAIVAAWSGKSKKNQRT